MRRALQAFNLWNTGLTGIVPSSMRLDPLTSQYPSTLSCLTVIFFHFGALLGRYVKAELARVQEEYEANRKAKVRSLLTVKQKTESVTCRVLLLVFSSSK